MHGYVGMDCTCVYVWMLDSDNVVEMELHQYGAASKKWSTHSFHLYLQGGRTMILNRGWCLTTFFLCKSEVEGKGSGSISKSNKSKYE